MPYDEHRDTYLGDGVYVPRDKRRWWRNLLDLLRSEPDVRPRCIADDKVVFRTSADAERVAMRVTRRGTAMRAYLGACGHWHLARVKRRKR